MGIQKLANQGQFDAKVDELVRAADKKSNMWIDDNMNCSKKNGRFLRILKTLLHAIGIDAFGHIRVNKVANKMFQFAEKNKDFLDAKNAVKLNSVLSKLNSKTHNNYKETIELTQSAIKGILLPEDMIEVPEPSAKPPALPPRRGTPSPLPPLAGSPPKPSPVAAPPPPPQPSPVAAPPPPPQPSPVAAPTPTATPPANSQPHQALFDAIINGGAVNLKPTKNNSRNNTTKGSNGFDPNQVLGVKLKRVESRTTPHEQSGKNSDTEAEKDSNNNPFAFFRKRESQVSMKPHS
ncbi:MAG: hypothetical protein AAGG81_08570 [Chlamydiota bacterium]